MKMAKMNGKKQSKMNEENTKKKAERKEGTFINLGVIIIHKLGKQKRGKKMALPILPRKNGR
jgi:hypothetical protein